MAEQEKKQENLSYEERVAKAMQPYWENKVKLSTDIDPDDPLQGELPNKMPDRFRKN